MAENGTVPLDEDVQKALLVMSVQGGPVLSAPRLPIVHAVSYALWSRTGWQLQEMVKAPGWWGLSDDD